VRPLAELDFAHELRLDPDDVPLLHLRHLRHRLEGRRRALQRLKQAHELVDLLVGETGAAVADVNELVAALDSEDERAEAARAPALAP
jgi:hypothetical protein